MSENLAWLSARELTGLYAEGVVSPVEATRACLDRIAEHDEAVNAFVLVDRDAALAAARDAQERWRQGASRGRLDGVPVSIKDLLLMAGHPTRRGSRLTLVDPPAAEDSPATKFLRDAGAVILGKTTTPEFGWKGVTDSPEWGVTRNPWDHTRTAGGSSGGSAAAVALGMGPISIGTDGGGSVRIPASFSGVVGHKPTYGRVSTYPATAFGNLSHVGPMTRTVEDAAWCLDVISQPDPRDWSAAEASQGSFAEGLHEGIDGLRVAYSADLGFAQVSPVVAEVVARAIALLQTRINVERVDPGIEDPVEAFHTLWFSGAAGVLHSRDERERALADPGLLEIAHVGERLTALDYVRATAARADLGRRMGQFHQEFDILLTPTMPIEAFEAGHNVPPGSGMAIWTRWTPFTYPFNLTQQPALSLPCGTTSEGLPVGLQVVGRRFDDAAVLRFAQVCEELFAPLWSSRALRP